MGRWPVKAANIPARERMQDSDLLQTKAKKKKKRRSNMFAVPAGPRREREDLFQRSKGRIRPAATAKSNGIGYVPPSGI
jgi:hypothetical protein